MRLQGPAAKDVMAKLSDVAAGLAVHGRPSSGKVGEFDCHISRSGYTGEDGFEISVRPPRRRSWRACCWRRRACSPIGLGARDSLRLEAGLCLYGHDIDETTSPIEAGLAWSIQKRRREQGGFPGAARIQDELANGPKRRRVGIKPDGRAPAREGTEILALLGDKLGVVTSGGFGPSVNGPVAMGYVQSQLRRARQARELDGARQGASASVAPLPFVPHRYALNVDPAKG